VPACARGVAGVARRRSRTLASGGLFGGVRARCAVAGRGGMTSDLSGDGMHELTCSWHSFLAPMI